MIKQFSRMELAAIKRSMKNIAPLLRRRATLEKAYDKLHQELTSLDCQINAHKQLMEPFTGGIDPEIILAHNGQVELTEHPDIPAEEDVDMLPNSPEVFEEEDLPTSPLQQ